MPTHYRYRMPTPAPVEQAKYWYSFNHGPVHYLGYSTELDYAAGSEQNTCAPLTIWAGSVWQPLAGVLAGLGLHALEAPLPQCCSTVKSCCLSAFQAQGMAAAVTPGRALSCTSRGAQGQQAAMRGPRYWLPVRNRARASSPRAGPQRCIAETLSMHRWIQADLAAVNRSITPWVRAKAAPHHCVSG